MVTRGSRTVRADSGSGLLLTLLTGSGVTVLGILLLAMGEYAGQQQHIARVADSAALAAASALDDSGCAQAARVATANDAELRDCTVDGDDIVITVSTAYPLLLHRIADQWGQQLPALTASARAGPG